MSITIKGHNVDLGEALRTHITEKLNELSQKYFGRITAAEVIYDREGHHLFACHVTFQVGRGITVNADGEHPDAYAAFDEAADRIGRQLRRYKERLRSHNQRLDAEPVAVTAHDYVLETTSMETQENKDEPIIVAEMTANIQTMTVSEAVMRLDLGRQNAIMFKNASHGRLNMVYRRTDGNIGWIDPQEGEVSKAA